jgi:DNA-binding MarR family transcriptional regulator
MRRRIESKTTAASNLGQDLEDDRGHDRALVPDTLGRLLGYQLRRASSAMMSTLAEDLSPLGLTIVEASVLLVIADHPGWTQSDVGAHLEIHRANMAPMAAKLARRRLVTRERSSGRRAALHVSAQGERVASELRRVLARHDARYAAHLDPHARAQLLAWLRQVWVGSRD